uniref:Uncharacterized protein n=1 Tax=Aegilops tauschii subsp. strangulata TaxID=200361 RepID=A0A453GFI3_AEGTS
MDTVHIPPRIILDAMLKDTIAPKICILHPAYRKRWYRVETVTGFYPFLQHLPECTVKRFVFRSESSCYFFRFIYI